MSFNVLFVLIFIFLYIFWVLPLLYSCCSSSLLFTPKTLLLQQFIREVRQLLQTCHLSLIIFHHALCRDLQGLQDLTGSPVYQEIQESRDPQDTPPTLGWVCLRVKKSVCFTGKKQNTLLYWFILSPKGQPGVTDGCRFRWEVQSGWDGIRIKSECCTGKTNALNISHICKVSK